MTRTERRFALFAWFALASSLSTLVCCALPALLVALGAGAVLAGTISAVPQIVILSEQKVLVFAIAGALLAAASITQLAVRGAPCPTDSCRRLRSSAGVVFTVACVVFAIGAFFAFLAPVLFA